MVSKIPIVTPPPVIRDQRLSNKILFKGACQNIHDCEHLPQNALNGVQTALSDILLLKEPNNSFALLNAASYIGPFVDIKQLDVLFNQITNISICLKQCGQHWT